MEETIVKTKKLKISNRPIIYRRTGAERVIYIVMFVFFLLYAIILLAPILLMVMNSFKGALEYNDDMRNHMIYALPDQFRWQNYTEAFQYIKVPIGNREVGIVEMLFNTIWMAALPPILQQFVLFGCAYAFAKYNFKIKGFMYQLNLILMMMPIFGATVATMKLYVAYGLYNQPLLLYITALTGFGGQWLMTIGFFKGISWSYAEAVFLDGGGHFTAFFKVMLPQAMQLFGVFYVLAFIGKFQEYESFLLYMPDYCTLATGMYYCQTILPRRGEQPMYYAALFMSAIPLLIIFIIFSEKIMTSVTMEGLKG